ncbi:NAD-binding protein [Albidovulum sediminicola]|uniref:NAD-binding protein n=1 Tax=Albidovulum sediminicola TaxID=2984331 RepID=A0ABT2Z6M7_9RHOB|nr:NAD-binding protein [Defluviimonas sp. WL0075]MCV2866416.1 NAD-binding protein [Defluviimonas sp. WL0075]
MDAPISGGPEMVLAGNCGVFIGGEDAEAARARASLSATSGRIFHVGPNGTGLVMKVINNGMMQAYMAGLADLLPLAKRAGLSLENALRILSGGPAGQPVIAARIPKILGEDDTVGFAVSAVFKDNDVARHVLKSFGLTSPILDVFAHRRDAIEKAGLMDHDPAAILRNAYYEDGDAPR